MAGVCSHDYCILYYSYKVSDQKKLVGSTEGMQSTYTTSDLMAERLRILPERVKQVEQAILNKDFHTFAECAMKV